MNKPNKENIALLIATLEKTPLANESEAEAGFGMNYLTHDCGTPSCIAGFAAWFSAGMPENVLKYYSLNPERGGMNEAWVMERAAADWLGLEVEDHYRYDTEDFPLFYPGYMEYYAATPAQAIKVLQYFSDTGIVDWSKSGIELNSEPLGE